MTHREFKELLIAWLATRDRWVDTSDIPEINLDLSSLSSTSPRKLRAIWSVESSQDLMCWHYLWDERFAQNLSKVQDYLNYDKR